MDKQIEDLITSASLCATDENAATVLITQALILQLDILNETLKALTNRAVMIANKALPGRVN